MKPEQALSLYGRENPFSSVAALRTSNYSASIGGRLVRLLDWREPTAQARRADRALRSFLLSSAFSCVAGKAAVESGGYRFASYSGFGDPVSLEGLARDLAAFVSERPSMVQRYTTFVAVFDEAAPGAETWFEAGLWRVLQGLANLGAPHYSWDPRASSDPMASNFGFSFAGEAFFVVGMHPNSSRLSRRFFLPALAFNSHRQFREARRSGRFSLIQRLVRGREVQLQGSINPELREFGHRSEARQYSGRQTEVEWRCPFQTPS
ncbi:MAG: guanitoxin biosynthesis heme-dependent pre-guanitoxin N-hydroxylase GntA [Candidatus Cybelea sp.]